MSITGADAFALTLRDKLKKTRARIVELHEMKNAVLARGDVAADQAAQIIKQAEAEIAQFEGELRQLSNFPPADDGAPPPAKDG